jgi:glycine/D-amino acid oxidase-like deaminating enzyme
VQSIVIAGGGIIGSSIAFHLALRGLADRVVVVEPDPTYQWAATPRAVGGVRMLQGVLENAQMSLYGYEFYGDFANRVGAGEDDFGVRLKRQGFMFTVAGNHPMAMIEASAERLRGLGIEIELFDRMALHERFPSFDYSDRDGAILSPRDSTIDPNGALMGFRKGALRLGVTYLQDRVVDLESADGLVKRARLQSGDSLAVDTLVNAANCWAPEICAMVGMSIPVAPLPRQTFYFDTRSALEPIPAVRDWSGISFRSEGPGYLSGWTRPADAGAFNWELDYSKFDEMLWPRLAELTPAFEAVKVQSGWVGHYDQCLLDGNPIISRWSDRLDNFIVTAGFSGHGMQHAPAVGRAVSELIVDGSYQTLDISRLGYDRVEVERPIPDPGPTA